MTPPPWDSKMNSKTQNGAQRLSKCGAGPKGDPVGAQGDPKGAPQLQKTCIAASIFQDPAPGRPNGTLGHQNPSNFPPLYEIPS